MPGNTQRHYGLRAWFRDGLISIFLPVGFPDSVTDDFVQFIPLRG